MATLEWCLFLLCFTSHLLVGSVRGSFDHKEYISSIGDPGMKRDGLRVAIESWNQCNEVGQEIPAMGSPRAADCFDLDRSQIPPKLVHRVNERDNKLGAANSLLGRLVDRNPDHFAALKELYLGTKCQVQDEDPSSILAWQFWMIMLKSGNFDTTSGICPNNGKKSVPFPPESRFPCFGKGCMNMPLMFHDYTRLRGGGDNLGMRGCFYGSWDLDVPRSSLSCSGNAAINKKNGTQGSDLSFYSVVWEKRGIGKGSSWVFHHTLRTSVKYPWLMLYLRSDATEGVSGGYHYPSMGMSKIIPKSPDFKVRFKLKVKQGGGDKSQFYLLDIGGCWKNNGRRCDGDTASDVTRYSEMIINPAAVARCQPDDIAHCPPRHTFPNGTTVHRSDTANFPYGAYHLYCAPGNAAYLEQPYHPCDEYSNPQAQEILQILPHPVWGEYGYPTRMGQGWIGDARKWELDAGRLSHSLYFYQDPGTKKADRFWPSVDLGTEIYISGGEIAKWSVSDFDIIIPKTRITDL